ncbi:MAG: hypothetical protein EBZ49_08485 [Proteobacteria bacterium]|nr:hypothetical protein [Pseudomonadota bacterium]
MSSDSTLDYRQRQVKNLKKLFLMQVLMGKELTMNPTRPVYPKSLPSKNLEEAHKLLRIAR